MSIVEAVGVVCPRREQGGREKGVPFRASQHPALLPNQCPSSVPTPTILTDNQLPLLLPQLIVGLLKRPSQPVPLKETGWFCVDGERKNPGGNPRAIVDLFLIAALQRWLGFPFYLQHM